ncbi:MAG TPA: hypothetical protein VJ814_06190 [Gaiellaceae bacterium]|nr:hypothetical protein [Gaiellaceae bacterium]
MKRLVALCALFAGAAVLLLPAAGSASSGPGSAAGASSPSHTCKIGLPLCTDPADPINDLAGGPYVGHDEPSLLFYDQRHGSGNDVTYNIRLPKDPPTMPTQDSANGVYWAFTQRAAYWFGMIMCDTQSAPEYQHDSCKPDSDGNIFDSTDPNSPRYIGKAPGNAYMELQFYPPGWVPQFTGFDCPGTKWCVNLTIDSLNIDQNNGVSNNDACANSVGLEPVNWAYLTRNGKPHAPPDPISLVTNPDTGNPNPQTDLELNGGDRLQLHMFDTPQGFKVVVHDFTTHQSGSMTASAANGFEQILFQPDSKTCNEAPYSFHPEFDTSTKATRSSWAAHTYNVAGSDEIGHFEYCDQVTSDFMCAAASTDPGEPESGFEDYPCFDSSYSSLVLVSGCLSIFGDTDFDAPAYTAADWAGNSTAAHDAAFDPEPIQFMTPTIRGTHTPFSQVAFEADTPSFEAECNIETGVGCTGQPVEAQFYPIYTAGHLIGGGSFGPGPAGPHHGHGHGGPHGHGHGPHGQTPCVWQFGGPNYTGTTNNFGGTANAEYGAPFASVFPDPGPQANTFYTTVHRDLSGNPCAS